MTSTNEKEELSIKLNYSFNELNKTSYVVEDFEVKKDKISPKM